MKRNRTILTALTWLVLTTVMLGGEATKPATLPAGEPGLVEKALQEMGGAEEIVFAVRGLCSATQCYATFGVLSNEPTFVHAPDGSRLSRLNLRTGEESVLLEDPKGGFRDPRVHYNGGKILFS